jgi:hypothetical protein
VIVASAATFLRFCNASLPEFKNDQGQREGWTRENLLNGAKSHNVHQLHTRTPAAQRNNLDAVDHEVVALSDRFRRAITS